MVLVVLAMDVEPMTCDNVKVCKCQTNAAGRVCLVGRDLRELYTEMAMLWDRAGSRRNLFGV